MYIIISAHEVCDIFPRKNVCLYEANGMEERIADKATSHFDGYALFEAGKIVYWDNMFTTKYHIQTIFLFWILTYTGKYAKIKNLWLFLLEDIVLRRHGFQHVKNFLFSDLF